ncbi:MAG: GNAT family N-acetyltransferase [Myxococcales bacterium]
MREAADYFRRSEGRVAPEEWAADHVGEALADEQRRLFVLAAPDRDVGLLELALDVPAPQEATVVLLVFAAAVRGRGLGRVVASALFSALASEGFDTVRLGVARRERGAAEFWAAVGLSETGSEPGVRLFERSLRDS